MSAENNKLPVLVIGCGRRHMSDDAIGLVVADELASLSLPDLRVIASESPGSDIPNEVAGAELLILVDAARLNGLPIGQCLKLDYPSSRTRLMAGVFSNTHGLGVLEGLEIARLLGLLPPTVWIYAVSATIAGFGANLSTDVEQQVSRIARRISKDINYWIENRRIEQTLTLTA